MLFMTQPFPNRTILASMARKVSPFLDETPVAPWLIQVPTFMVGKLVYLMTEFWNPKDETTV